MTGLERQLGDTKAQCKNEMRYLREEEEKQDELAQRIKDLIK